MSRKTETLLAEAEYYTGVQTGTKAPETLSAYEYNRDNVPTLKKIGDLKSQNPNDFENPQALPFPLQMAVQQLGDLFLSTQDLRNKVRQAEQLPVFKEKKPDLKDFREKLNGIMVAYRQLVQELHKFSLSYRN